MKLLTIPALLAAGWLLAFAPRAAQADETLKRVQQSLRDQGFYYGSIDGSPGDESTQAIRRFQIRNGLGVTGQLNEETRGAILKDGGGGTSVGGGRSAASTPPPLNTPTPRPRATPSTASTLRPAASPTPARPAPRPAATPAPAQPRTAATPRPAPRADYYDDEGGFHRGGAPANPPSTRTVPERPGPNLRSSDNDDEDDDERPVNRPDARPDLRAGPGQPPPYYRDRVPRDAVAPSATLTTLFEGTPYEFAPPPVQADTLRRAQSILLRQGFYDREPDGRPNRLMPESLANFQAFNRLPRTGRLDSATLGVLRLLPGHHSGMARDEVYEGRVVR